MRLGVVGCGRAFEHFHLPALRASFRWELVAVCDSDPRRRKWAERTSPGLAGFNSLKQMLHQAELDAVLIATPPRAHTVLAAEAIDRGLHVLVEKPGGRSLADGEKLAALGAHPDRVLWIGYNRRFNPNYQAIRDMLRVAPPSAGAVIRLDLSLSVMDWDSISGYLGEGNQGGDVVRDVVSHQLDLLAWMFASPVASVRSRTWDKNGPAAERLVYEVRLETGVRIQCLAEHGVRYRESFAVEVGNRKLLSHPTGRVTTERGSWGALKEWAKLRYWIDRKLIRIGMLADPQELSYKFQLEAFAKAVRGERPSVTGSSVDSLLMTHRAMNAMLNGRGSPGEWQTVTHGSDPGSEPMVDAH